MVQEEKEEKSGVGSILSKHHVYIDTCASYASTPHPKLLENTRKQACNLVGHSNAGSCRMDTAREMRAVKKMYKENQQEFNANQSKDEMRELNMFIVPL
jgi:hypothetical protein